MELRDTSQLSNGRGVQVAFDAGVALITLDNHRRGNLLTPALLKLLQKVLSRVADDPECRVVLLRSAGSIFCRGMDLNMVGHQADEPGFRTHLSQSTAEYRQLLMTIQQMPKPVVAVVAGEATAGGVGLAGACDIVYATPQAQFGLSEVLFGLIPANLLPFLIGSRLSPQKARYLMLTAKRLDAEQARQVGLVDEVVSASDMERALRSLCKQLLRSSPRALAVAKEFAQQIAWQPPAQVGTLAGDTLMELMTSPAVREGLAAFEQGETPAWFARYRPQQALFVLPSSNDREPPSDDTSPATTKNGS